MGTAYQPYRAQGERVQPTSLIEHRGEGTAYQHYRAYGGEGTAYQPYRAQGGWVQPTNPIEHMGERVQPQYTYMHKPLQISERDKLGTGTLWNAVSGMFSEFQLSKIEVGQLARLSTS